MILSHGLTVRRGERILAGPIDLTLAEGEAVLLSGVSGSGKSTILRAIAGVLPPEFELDGECTAPRVGYLPQNPSHALLCARVDEEVASAARNFGLSDPEGCGRATLADLGGAHLLVRSCRDLSSGEAQRVALAAAIAGGAGGLLLDEPTAFLDPPGVEGLRRLLQAAKARGVSLLIAEHRPERLSRLFDRTIEIGEAPESESLPSHREMEIGEIVLRARGVRHEFGGRSVLLGVDLDVRKGERIAILGSNGAGKTTLGRILAGLLKPDAGRVSNAVGSRVRPGLDAGLTPPDPDEALLGETVAEELAIGPENFGRSPDPDLPARLRLEGRRGDSPARLSHGERVRLVVGATLAVEPSALILDEPTIGADLAGRERLLVLLEEFSGAVVVLTHDGAFAARLATRTMRLEGGRLEEMKRGE